MEELDDIAAGDVDLLNDLREQYTKPHELAILDWIETSGLEDVVFYPQGNPTILITWATPDSQDRYLFREIDIVVEGDDRFRVSGGAMYHAPSYHIGWLSHKITSTDTISATLTGFHEEIEKLEFEDLTEMETYLTGFMKDLLDA